MIEIENMNTNTQIALNQTEIEMLLLKKQIDLLNDRLERGRTLQRLVWLLDNSDEACYTAREGLFLRGMVSFRDVVENRVTNAEAEQAFERYISNPNKDDEAVLKAGLRIQSSKIEGMRVVLGKPFTDWEADFDTLLMESNLLGLEEQLILLEEASK